MRYEQGVTLWPYHRERLKRSTAHFFQFLIDLDECEAQCQKFCKTLDPKRAHKVRMVINRTGQCRFEASVIEPWPSLKLTQAAQSMHTSNVFLYHKTTCRQMYHQPWKEARADGYGDVFF